MRQSHKERVLTLALLGTFTAVSSSAFLLGLYGLGVF